MAARVMVHVRTFDPWAFRSRRWHYLCWIGEQALTEEPRNVLKQRAKFEQRILNMTATIVGAIGYSLIYLLLGGGLGGAVLIFLVAKMLGR